MGRHRDYNNWPLMPRRSSSVIAKFQANTGVLCDPLLWYVKRFILFIVYLL